MFLTMPGGAFGIDPEDEVEADALAGPQARDHEAALAADATQLRSALTKVIWRGI